MSIRERHGLAGHRRRLGVDERMAGRLNQLCGKPQLLELGRDPFGRFPDVACMARIGAHARNAQQVRQIVDKRLAMRLDVFVGTIHAGPSCLAWRKRSNIMGRNVLHYRKDRATSKVERYGRR